MTKKYHNHTVQINPGDPDIKSKVLVYNFKNVLHTISQTMLHVTVETNGFVQLFRLQKIVVSVPYWLKVNTLVGTLSCFPLLRRHLDYNVEENDRTL